MQPEFVFDHYFLTQSFEAFKQAYEASLPDDAVPDKSVTFPLVYRSCESEPTNVKRGTCTKMCGDTLNICWYYVIFI